MAYERISQISLGISTQPMANLFELLGDYIYFVGQIYYSLFIFFLSWSKMAEVYGIIVHLFFTNWQNRWNRPFLTAQPLQIWCCFLNVTHEKNAQPLGIGTYVLPRIENKFTALDPKEVETQPPTTGMSGWYPL